MLSVSNPLCNPRNYYMLRCEEEYNRLIREAAQTIDEKGWQPHYPIVNLMYYEVAVRVGREFIRWMYNVRLMPNDPFEAVCEMADRYYDDCWRYVFKYAGLYQGQPELRKVN